MSRPDWLEGLREDLPSTGDSFWDDVRDEAGAPSVDEALSRNLYESAISFDPGARMPRRLAARLVGERAVDGRLAYGTTEEVLHGVRSEVTRASETLNLDAPEFDLVGIGPGSAILYLEPVVAEDHGDASTMPIILDPVDAVMETITSLHDVAESGGDLRQFSDRPELIKALRELTRTLDRHGLHLDLTWQSGTGRQRHSRLTTTAFEHIQRLWELDIDRVARTITGYVVAVTLSGFTLKSGLARNARKFDIQVADGETRMLQIQRQLPLGQWVSVLVDEVQQSNALGIIASPHFEFRRIEATGTAAS